jgi:hypothetical protein
MTRIVNVRVAHIRPDFNNLSEWMDDPDHVYIGRKGVVFIDGVRFPKEDSIWANPYKKKERKGGKAVEDVDVEEVVDRYERYIIDRLDRDPDLVDQLLELEGKTLGCWCKPKSCHGDVLIRLIEQYREKGGLDRDEVIDG